MRRPSTLKSRSRISPVDYQKTNSRGSKINSLGQKHDGGKRRWALLPWREIGQVVDVLTKGAIKYSPDNWKKVPEAERRYFEATMRHITARLRGRIRDKEQGTPHLANAICGLLFWLWFDNENRRGHR